MSVYRKLMEARIALQSVEIKKSGHNKFSGYEYFSLVDFLPIVQKVLAENNLCGIVSFDSAYATLTINEIDGEGKIVFSSPMGSAQLKGCHEVQNIGAVETYQRRYLYMVAMEIVEHEALDDLTGKGAKKTITPTSGAWDTQPFEKQEMLRGIAEEAMNTLDNNDARVAVLQIEACNLDNEERIALWTLFNSKQRRSLKEAAAELKNGT